MMLPTDADLLCDMSIHTPPYTTHTPGWHVYAVEWFEDRIDFYVDDALYLTREGSQVRVVICEVWYVICEVWSVMCDVMCKCDVRRKGYFLDVRCYLILFCYKSQMQSHNHNPVIPITQSLSHHHIHTHLPGCPPHIRTIHHLWPSSPIMAVPPWWWQ